MRALAISAVSALSASSRDTSTSRCANPAGSGIVLIRPSSNSWDRRHFGVAAAITS